jgi:ESS family glutamate:Na+ symporter
LFGLQGVRADVDSIFPDHAFELWTSLPGLLINVMSASLLLGERTPAPRKTWGIAGPHVIMAGIMSAGQFAVAALVVLALLGPAFDFSDKGGASRCSRSRSSAASSSSSSQSAPCSGGR